MKPYQIALALIGVYGFASTAFLTYKLGLEHGTQASPKPISTAEFIQSNKEQVNNVCYVWWFKTPPKDKVLK